MHKKTLNNETALATPGYGTAHVGSWQEASERVTVAVSTALKVGYRHIDTASLYGNEKSVGEAIRRSSIPREDIMLVTKVQNAEQGYDETLQAFDKSLERLNIGYIDMYLIHWPVPDKYPETWRAMERIYSEGKAKAIGVSNFHKHHLEYLFDNFTVTPAVNQIELHPYLNQEALVAFCKQHDIQVVSWSPLGTGYWGSVPSDKKHLNDTTLKEIATRYNKSVAQVILRWNIQRDIIPIPKSESTERIQSNFNIFDFELTYEDMQSINDLDKGDRLSGKDPDDPSTWE